MATLLFRARCKVCQSPLIIKILDSAYAANPIVRVRCMGCGTYNTIDLRIWAPPTILP